MKSLTATILSFLFLPITVPLNALAVLALWAWFAVPLGVPSIGLWEAAGLALLAAYVTQPAPDFKEKNDDDDRLTVFVGGLIFALLKPAIVLPIAYVLHLLAS